MEGRADQGCLVQPLNFLLQWAWRFRCSGFGQTCLLYLFVFSLSSSSFPPNASSRLQDGVPSPCPQPDHRTQQLLALCGGSTCTSLLVFAVAAPPSVRWLRGLFSILPAQGAGKTLEAARRGSGKHRYLLPGQRAIYTRNLVAGPWGPTAPRKFAWRTWAQSQSMPFRGNV